MKRESLALILLGTAVLAGCSDYTCEEWCEDRSECSDSNLVKDECDEDCEQTERLNEASDCDGDFDEFLECMGSVSDVCDDDETDDCALDAAAYLSCVLSFCGDNPNDPACTGEEEPPPVSP